MRTATRCGMVALLGAIVAGCGPQKEADSGPSAEGAKYLLAEEPAGARGVKEVRARARDGDEVVVVGRIGGEEKPWVEGRAGFLLIDPSFVPCNERQDDDCPTPWDYCCDDPAERRKGMATVKVVDERGKALGVDARQLLGVKELDTVVVRGKAKRDEKGNLTLLATGLYKKAGGKR